MAVRTATDPVWAQARVFAGYEQRRAELAEWVDHHLIGEFGLEPCRMLDAGCGNGFWSSLFADRGFDVRGFDIEPTHIRDARRKHPGVRFTVADLNRLPKAFFAWEPELAFARTIPPFYSANVEDATDAFRCLLAFDCPVLASAYSTQTAERVVSPLTGIELWMHPHTELVGAFVAAGGEITKVVSALDRLQIYGRRA